LELSILIITRKTIRLWLFVGTVEINWLMGQSSAQSVGIRLMTGVR
jgi:hypothetical protein